MRCITNIENKITVKVDDNTIAEFHRGDFGHETIDGQFGEGEIKGKLHQLQASELIDLAQWLLEVAKNRVCDLELE